MKRFLTSGSIYGKLMLLVGILVSVPLLVLPFYRAETKYTLAFLAPAAFSIIIGFIIIALTYTRNYDSNDSEWHTPVQKGSIPVMFAWCYGIILGAVPFVIGNQLGIVCALFESVSGWTTTGLSVVSDVMAMPRIFLLHRSFMQCSGGLGFILMMVMFVQNKQVMNLYSAEGHADMIRPNLRRTARVIFGIYCGFHVIGITMYRVFGMELFDAICHTMAALSTAGFTTQASSIGAYDSFPIELITTVLMLIGASNFAVLFLLAELKMKQVFKVTEMRFMLGLVAVFVPLSVFSLFISTDLNVLSSLRQALFGVVTTFSTTGFSTMDYSLWPPFALGLIMLLMIIGGSSGSTAGGIKLSRAYFVLRITHENIRKRFSPARKVSAPGYYTVRGRAAIDDSLIADTFGFIACYLGLFVIGSLLLTLTSGYSLFDTMYEFASAFGTVGISNGLTGAGQNAATLLILMVGMLLGRLEIFIVFIGIASSMKLLLYRKQKTR